MEIRPWRKCPFVPGKAYRIRRGFAALRDTFVTGEIITYESEAWSRYDGKTSYFFSQIGQQSLRVWDTDDDDDKGNWMELFEQLPDRANGADP